MYNFTLLRDGARGILIGADIRPYYHKYRSERRKGRTNKRTSLVAQGNMQHIINKLRLKQYLSWMKFTHDQQSNK